MTIMKLRRKAPATQTTTCAVCDTPSTRRGSQLADQLVVGQPGAATHVGEVCEVCGRVLDQVVGKFGPTLTVLVDECQRQAGAQEITVARVDRDATQAHPPD